MPYDPLVAAQKALLVQFVYDMYATDPNSLTPAVDPRIAQNGYRLVHYLKAKDIQDEKFYGYLAASVASPGDLVLAIRGTQTAQEWLLNFNALPLPYLGKGFVPAGFRSIAQTFQLSDTAGTDVGNLTDTLNSYNAQTHITSITVLGHSLGGALATLAAAQIAFTGVPNGAALSMWTYASPTVGFPDFAGAFNRAVPESYRIWNSLDIVPQVPPFPYLHVGQSEELKQTPAQIQQLLVTPPCEHHLTTYEWLLDPAHFSLDSGCALNAARPMAARAHIQGGMVETDEAAQGAQALADALQQWQVAKA